MLVTVHAKYVLVEKKQSREGLLFLVNRKPRVRRGVP